MWRLAFLSGLSAGWLSGGSIRNLAYHDLRAMPTIFAVAAFQLVISFGAKLGPLREIAPMLHLLSYLPLFWALWANRHIRGISLVALGTVLNFLPIAANGGKMPVGVEALDRLGDPDAVAVLWAGESFTHVLSSAGTRLTFLGDVLFFPDLYIFPHMVLSIGDVFMALGVVLILRHLMVAPEPSS